jgi:hypothetical protein
MSKRESTRKDAIWLWTGRIEYEGEILTLDGNQLTARVRQVRRWSLATGAPGRSVPSHFLEQQRELTLRLCFGQSPAIQLGGLLEFRIEAVQSSGDRQFDYVLAGTFSPVADEHLDALSQLDSDEALRFLESRRDSVDGGRSAKSSFGT